MLSKPRISTYYSELVNSIAVRYGYKFLHQWRIVDYDYRFHTFASELASLKKDTFAPEEKFLIEHADVEYFVNGFGFSIDNFNTMIRSLDIDPCRFVILTNHYCSTQKWNSYCSDPNNQFHVIETPLSTLLVNHDYKPVTSAEECQYRFCSMLGKSRVHRDILAKYFISQNLVKDNLISVNLWPERASSRTKTRQDEQKYINNLFFLRTDPFARINEHWIHDQSLLDIEKFVVINGPLTNDILNSATKSLAPEELYKKIFVDIVAESVYNYPHAYISEKTIRPIISSRPFIIVGAPGTLAWLHQLGFKTFDQYWDEDYDQCTDSNQRFHKIFKLIETINSWPIAKCQEILTSMMEIFKHNIEVYNHWVENPLHV